MRSAFLKIIGVLGVILAPVSAFAGGEMWLTMDQVRVYDMKRPVASIVVGNPAIADVTVQNEARILLYGKTPGLTNIYFFDADGKRIDSIDIRVQSASGNMLVLNRGTERATYTCTRKCELTAAVGDSTEVFGQVTQQATTKNNTAMEAAGSSSGN